MLPNNKAIHLGHIFLALLFLFIIGSGGRLNSSDAHAQLQQSMILATTGSIKTYHPPSDTFLLGYWNGTPSSGYYEKQDIGNVLLMLPAAWIAYRVATNGGRAWYPEDIEYPPILANFLVGMTDAAVSALGCTYLFAFFLRRFGSGQLALILTLGYMLGTVYAVYSKSAWDVSVGASALCVVLFYASKALSLESSASVKQRIGSLVPVVLASLLACLFRFELTPFLLCAISALSAIVLRVKGKGFVHLLCAILVCSLPLFLINYVRTGSPFTFAKTGGAPLQAAFQGDLLTGLYGNTFAPNHGLFVFSPVLILALLVAVPFVWKRIMIADQFLIAIYGTLAIAYLLVISKLGNWAAHDFSWGARFTVNILPILYVSAIVAANAVSKTAWRLAAALLAVGAVINVPAAIVNTQLLLSLKPAVIRALAPQPLEMIAVWNAFALGLEGKPLPVPVGALRNQGTRLSAGFPDLWWTRFFNQPTDARIGDMAIGSIACILFIAMLFTYLSTVKQARTSVQTTE